MNEQFIKLTDGTRLEAKISFATLYHLQKCGAQQLANKIKKQEKKGRNPSDSDTMEFAAKVIYATLRSNGRKVTFDEALELMPPDVEELQLIVDSYQEEMEKLKKKQIAKKSMQMMQQK